VVHQILLSTIAIFCNIIKAIKRIMALIRNVNIQVVVFLIINLFPKDLMTLPTMVTLEKAYIHMVLKL